MTSHLVVFLACVPSLCWPVGAGTAAVDITGVNLVGVDYVGVDIFCSDVPVMFTEGLVDLRVYISFDIFFLGTTTPALSKSITLYRSCRS
jgi:hypothetical protein